MPSVSKVKTATAGLIKRIKRIMDINEIFRQSGEPTYYTPVDIYPIIFDWTPTMAIGNPPFTSEK